MNLNDYDTSEVELDNNSVYVGADSATLVYFDGAAYRDTPTLDDVGFNSRVVHHVEDTLIWLVQRDDKFVLATTLATALRYLISPK